jgi:hypothetical protein
VGIVHIQGVDVKTSGPARPDGFAEALRAAIAARGVSLVWVRDRLANLGSPVSLTTLSYWRTGHRHPEGAGSLAAVCAIEELLRVPPGHLVAKVPPSRRTGPLPSPRIPIADEDLRRAMKESLDAVSAPPLNTLRDLSAHVVADVDERGRLRRRHIRMLVQATSGSLDRMAWVEVSRSPTLSAPRVISVSGARVTLTHQHPDQRVRSYAFALDRETAAPDTALLEWTTEFDDDYPAETEVGHFVARPARETVIWVRFHPDHLPAWCEELTDQEEPRPLELGTGHAVHAVRVRFGPGVLTVRWGFDASRNA